MPNPYMHQNTHMPKNLKPKCICRLKFIHVLHSPNPYPGHSPEAISIQYILVPFNKSRLKHVTAPLTFSQPLKFQQFHFSARIVQMVSFFTSPSLFSKFLSLLCLNYSGKVSPLLPSIEQYPPSSSFPPLGKPAPTSYSFVL